MENNDIFCLFMQGAENLCEELNDSSVQCTQHKQLTEDFYEKNHKKCNAKFSIYFYYVWL